ncbi:MAG TPA: LUD domain-containing protein [Candidatus Acidoferrales bacterium]|nr:LUD domain-containing protein [Candidatus Acidoferrales bacterium]
MPMSARDEIIARIQRSFAPAARSSAEDHAAIPRDYVQTGTLDPEARLDLFEDRLRDYDTEVYRCAPAQLPETIAIAMNAAGVSSLVIADDIGPNWLPKSDGRGNSPATGGLGGRSFSSDITGDAPKRALAPEAKSGTFSFIRDENLSYADLDRAEGVLTTCAVAIALTGTIILRHGRSGRRAMTLIPDYHLCIVRASQVVETVPEAIRELESPTRSPITTISGPSATSDIEMTRIKGVHGPRRLAVILIIA